MHPAPDFIPSVRKLNFGNSDLKNNRCVRVVGIIAVFTIITMVGILLFSQGQDISFKAQYVKFSHFFASIGRSQASIISCAVLGGLILGGAGVIAWVKKHPRRIAATEKLIKKPIEIRLGNLWGTKQYKKVKFTDNDGYDRSGYLDFSALDTEGNGMLALYPVQGCGQNEVISIEMIPGAALQCVGSMVYHVLRIPAIVFYTFFQFAREKITDKEIYKDNPFKAKDILLQPLYSLAAIVKAPFFATALIMSKIYSCFIDPLNGRKLAAHIEMEWNYNYTNESIVPMNRGVWLFKQVTHMKFEGGGNPANLGDRGHYFAGCRQPIAYVQCQDSKVIELQNRAGGTLLSGEGIKYLMIDPDL